MSRKSTIVVVFCVACLTVVLFFWRYQPAHEVRESMTNLKTHDGQIRAQSPRKMILQAINVPIEFWGLAVDESDQPVAGVSIRYSTMEGGHLDWKTYQNMGQLTSGVDGTFYIRTGDAWVLEIDSMEKTGYRFAKGKTAFTYSGDNQRFTPNKDKPEKFILVKDQGPPRLSRYNKYLSLPWNGTPVRLSVATGSPDTQGELVIAVNRTPGSEPGFYSWSCRIEVLNGGIQVRRGYSEAIAPSDGYLKFIEKPEGSKIFDRRGQFWAKSSEGVFALIELFLNEEDQPGNQLSGIQAQVSQEPGNRIFISKE